MGVGISNFVEDSSSRPILFLTVILWFYICAGVRPELSTQATTSMPSHTNAAAFYIVKYLAKDKGALKASLLVEQYGLPRLVSTVVPDNLHNPLSSRL